MMPRFHRYILFEIFKLFAIALLAVTTLIVMGWVVERAVIEGVRGHAILKLIPYILPMSLQFSLPTTLLFAVASVYGRMAADNEVVAIKGSGISPITIMRPTMILAFVMSPIGVWLTDLAASWGAPGMTQVVVHSLEEIAYHALRDRKYYGQKGFHIEVEDVEDHWLISPVITLYGPSGGNPQVISAKKAQLTLDPNTESLTIELIDFEAESGDNKLRDTNRFVFSLDLDRATRKGKLKDAPATIALGNMSHEIRQERLKLRALEDEYMAHLCAATVLGRADFFIDGAASDLRARKDGSETRLRKLQIEPWRRWALGFSSFFFVWMGLPLAIYMRNADYSMTFGVCFLPILLVYFPLFGLGLDQAKSGEWPAYSVWIGNLVLFAIGSYIIRVVYRS